MREERRHAESAPVALITGASSGFGLLSALALAEAGYDVYASMRDPGKRDELDRIAAERGLARRLFVLRLDVTDPASIEQAVRSMLAGKGRIDLLVNNAGYAQGGFVEEVPMEKWREQMETNFFGLLAVTQAVIPAMRAQGSGRILNISSVSGLVAIPGYAPYAASKFAVEGLSESLRHELRPFGIHVVLVEPGSYRTAIWDKGLARLETGAANDSPYRSMLAALIRISRHSAQTAPDPRQVAELIVRIARMRSPRLRYAIGQGSRALRLAKLLLPWKWLERAIAGALRS